MKIHFCAEPICCLVLSELGLIISALRTSAQTKRNQENPRSSTCIAIIGLVPRAAHIPWVGQPGGKILDVFTGPAF